MAFTHAPAVEQNDLESDNSPPGFAERRVAPERVRALQQAENGLRGGLARHPLLYGTLIVAAVFVTATALGTISGRALVGDRDDLRAAAGFLGADIVGAVCVALLLSRLGWWREVGFGGPSTWRSLHLVAFPAVIAVVALAGGLLSLDLSEPLVLAIRLPEVLLTGFYEEALTRGLLLSLLLVVAVRAGRGPVGAVVLSAITFGALHLVNIVGNDLGSVLAQVVYATLIGIGFGALLLRTNALWLLVGLHALLNTGSVLAGDNDGAGGLVAVVILSSLPLALYGLFLLRRVRDGKPPAALERD